MKKKKLALTLVLLLGGLSAFLFNACDKDTNCYVDITALDETTKAPIQGAFVKIDIDSSYVNAQGYTDATGHFNTYFTAPAIFNVQVVYETGYDSIYTKAEYYCFRKGSNTIRLKEGDTIQSTVNVEKEIHREIRR